MSTLLVIEDDNAIRCGVVDALKFASYEVLEAGEGRLGMELAQTATFDLLLLDLVLPNHSGFEILRALREHRPGTPVIILSARGEEADRVKGLKLGADDYVVKPFSPRELTARVKAVLRRAPNIGTTTTPTAAPATDGLQIDESRMQASYAGQALVLSATELKLLRVLSRHPGRVYSREQLMDRAWDDPGAALERTVDAHIKTLRQKLRSISGDKEFIVTHRGFGYSYQAPTP